MDGMRKLKAIILLFFLFGLLISCDSKNIEEEDSTAKPSILDSAKEAAQEAGASIGAAVEQAAEGAQTAIDSAGEAAQDAAGQVGEAFGAASTVVVDQGGEVVDLVSETSQDTAEKVKERIASLKADEEGNFTVTIHEDEINQIIQIQELITDPIPGNPLKNTTVSFQEGVILFTADVYEPLVGQLLVRFSSRVDGRHVRFDVIDASLAGNETPQTVLDAAAATLDGTLGELLSFLPSTLRPREIVIGDGMFVLKGGGAE